ncbi:FAD:protein FMN transferase [bacterium HR29]|jgi:thiamine biosynthesis lipoprotein|nr:FAD:protein FMN transferase [bacterium HR29]
MGTEVDVVVRAADRPVAAFASVRAWFGTVEARLSRFRAESALERLNRGEVVDDWILAEVVRAAIAAWESTEGLVNPLVRDALEAAGYVDSFERLEGPRGSLEPRPVPNPGDAIELSETRVRLRAGRLDLGGLAKGWTVDRAAELLSEDGLAGLVNAGGDLRAIGEEAQGLGGWRAGVEAPGSMLAWEGIVVGGLATSSLLRRRWRTRDARWAHHIIDPRTGLPAEGPYVQVTVAAASCLWAEVWSKAILIGGPETLRRAQHAVDGILAVTADGTAERTGIFAKGR